MLGANKVPEISWKAERGCNNLRQLSKKHKHRVSRVRNDVPFIFQKIILDVSYGRGRLSPMF